MTRRKSNETKPEKDHPDQAIDTPLPGDDINEEAFKALQDAYEGDPEDG